MDKRITKTDYLLMFLILFILIGALAAFFYGVKVGKDKTTEKYEHMLAEKEEIAKELTAYHQQYLVSFYHTIYLPYRDFQKKWFSRMEALELQSGSVDPRDVMKELGKYADEKFEEIESMSMPASSPLLQESHDNYLKSLKLFGEATDRFSTKIGVLQGSELTNAISKDAFFAEAQGFGLVAQNKYYSSIVGWNETVQADLPATQLTAKDNLSFKEWGQLNLNLKNQYVTRIMELSDYYKPYYPHDLTIRIDEMILDGHAERLKLTSIKPIIEMLVDTDAVRSGDYLRRNQKFYKGETLPQLPFFFE